MKGEYKLKIEIMNQYRMIVDLEEHGKTEEVFRTFRTLDDFKESLEGTVDDLVSDNAEWIDEGQVMVVFGNLADSLSDVNRVKEFNRKGLDCDFGVKGYHTLTEILDADLAYIEGYGLVEDKDAFEIAFKEAAQKK